MASQPDLQSARRGIAATLADFVALRRDLHRHPELAFDEHRTSDLIGGMLESWGYDVVRGVGGSGIVASLRRGDGPGRIAIRADMDALPIAEETGLPHASSRPGVMHACGHDGHTAILLCAARQLAQSGQFDGTLRLIFQPAEEIAMGALRMLEHGLLDRFPVDAIFGLHNWPKLQAGRLGFVSGPAMASSDTGVVRIFGKGGHGAEPHRTIDPIVAAAAFVTAVQSIVARNIAPQDMAVATIGAIHAGSAGSIIPEVAELKFTLRAFDDRVRQQLKQRFFELAESQAASFGARAEVEIALSCASLFNHPAETEFARRVAIDTFGAEGVSILPPITAGEDFAYFLQKLPGCFVFVGNGDSAPLHSAKYDFDDAILAPAALYWVNLVQTRLNGVGDHLAG